MVDAGQQVPVEARAPTGCDEPFTIDLDSTVCETYGLAKEGAQHHNYAGQRGYYTLFAIAAGTGGILMARLRKDAPILLLGKAEPGEIAPCTRVKSLG